MSEFLKEEKKKEKNKRKKKKRKKKEKNKKKKDKKKEKENKKEKKGKKREKRRGRRRRRRRTRKGGREKTLSTNHLKSGGRALFHPCHLAGQPLILFAREHQFSTSGLEPALQGLVSAASIFEAGINGRRLRARRYDIHTFAGQRLLLLLHLPGGLQLLGLQLGVIHVRARKLVAQANVVGGQGVVEVVGHGWSVSLGWHQVWISAVVLEVAMVVVGGRR